MDDACRRSATLRVVKHFRKHGVAISLAFAFVAFAFTAYFVWSAMEYSHAIEVDASYEEKWGKGWDGNDATAEGFWEGRRNEQRTKALASAVFGLICVG